MTRRRLDQLIQASVENTVVTRLSSATEKIAEAMAREILAEPEFRRSMQASIREYFGHTVDALLEPNGRKPRRKRRRGGKA